VNLVNIFWKSVGLCRLTKVSDQKLWLKLTIHWSWLQLNHRGTKNEEMMYWWKLFFVEMSIRLFAIVVIDWWVRTHRWFTYIAVAGNSRLVELEGFIERTAWKIKQEWVLLILTDRAKSFKWFWCIGKDLESIRVYDLDLNLALIKRINARDKPLDI
jgi:hypothetical protein